MAAEYIVRSSFPAMKVTPGEHLAAEIKRLGLTRQKLAKMLGVQWPTVDRWTKDDGFNEKNQTSAALAMGLQWDHFRVADTAVAHRLRYEAELAAYLNGPGVPNDVTESERATLASVRLPLDQMPTEYFFSTLLHMLRGGNWLLHTDFEKELIKNTELNQRKNAELQRMRAAADAERKRTKTRTVKKKK
jgi:hypothetical protein